MNLSEEALRLHSQYRGKVHTVPQVPIRGFEDFAIWYTPGVAAPCRAIAADPDQVHLHTGKDNRVAIVSDGSRILGLGDIGPEAGLPVMEGKALLFAYLAGVDAVPICLDAHDPDEIIRTVEVLQPGFGGVNLEDIAQPKCFTVLDALRARCTIPVWHDDQQGTATVTRAALGNALQVVGKDLGRVRIALVGVGAANVATYRLLTATGVDPAAIVAVDRGGTLHPGRADLQAVQETFPDKWRICTESNADRVVGGIEEALRGADVCLAFSTPGPGVIDPSWVRRMAPEAVVFACANPVPEIWPEAAKDAGAAVVATGRSDFPNQVNNSLGFPGIFRGVLDVRAITITDTMAAAAAKALASCVGPGLSPGRIVPAMDEPDVVLRVAVATGMAAQADGVARRDVAEEALTQQVRRTVGRARSLTQTLMREGLIAGPT